MGERTDLEGRTLAMIEALGLPREVRSSAFEARARLTWGDSQQDVLAWLIGSGVDRPTAELIVETCVRERSVAMRQKGLRDLLVGCVAVAMGTLGAVGAMLFFRSLEHVPGRLVGLVVMAFVAIAVAGIYWFVRGLERVLFGARAEGAVSDVDEWE